MSSKGLFFFICNVEFYNTWCSMSSQSYIEGVAKEVSRGWERSDIFLQVLQYIVSILSTSFFLVSSSVAFHERLEIERVEYNKFCVFRASRHYWCMKCWEQHNWTVRHIFLSSNLRILFLIGAEASKITSKVVIH